MSLLSTPQTGRWRDHSDGHHLQTLQGDSWQGAQWFRVGIAISLTLASPYLLRIVLSTIWGLTHLFSRKASYQHQDEGNTHLVSTGSMGTGIGGKEGPKHWISDVFAQYPHWEARHRFFWAFVLASLLLVLYQSFVGVVSADNVARSRSALLKSDKCGLYEYDNEKAGEENAVRADMLMVERERRAAAYAQDCYHYDAKNNVKATNCNFFYNSTIGYRVQVDKCPFDRADICVDGYQPGSAITFDTKLVDSGILGINEESMHKFRRKTTCAPLSAGRPFVQHFTNSGTGESGYKYFYGSLYDTINCSEEVHAPPPVLSEYTMRITGHPFEWQAPVYKVNTYATSLLDPTCDFYQPSSDLQAPGLLPHRTKTLSLIFVTALRILYTKRSNDPIFPADKAFQYPGDKGYYYYNSQPKARAFACIDETIFCAPSGSPCWHANDPIPDGGSNTSAYWLMKYALKSSNTYDAIKLRLGSGLLAQQRVGQSRSMPLADNHWQLEAEHLFKTSLARAQFDAWSIASAEDHDNPTYTDTIPDEARGRLCGLFKFQASGYINIRIEPFVWLVLAWPLMLLLSLELKTYNKLWHIATSWITSLKKPPTKAPADANATTDTTTTSISHENTSPDPDSSTTPIAITTSSPSNHAQNEAVVSDSHASPNQAQPAFASTSNSPHADLDPGPGSLTSANLQLPSSLTSTNLQLPSASTLVPNPTTTTPSPRPNSPNSMTPLMDPSSRAPSSRGGQNYGTSIAANSMHSGRDSAQVVRRTWSPLLIHSPVVLGAWVFGKLRNGSREGRDGDEVV